MSKGKKFRGPEGQVGVFEAYAKGASIEDETRAAELAIAMDALKGMGEDVCPAQFASITERAR